jgi:hypothetical protein
VKIRIRTTVHMPEIPDEVETDVRVLQDLLLKLFARTPVGREVIDPRTGEMQLEDLFDVALNDVPHNSLPEGLRTPLHDGDTVRLSLILLGGG